MYRWDGAAYAPTGLQPIANQTILGNVSGATATPVALTKAQGQTLLDIGWVLQSKSTALPNGTVPAHVLSATGAEANIDVVVSPKGSGAILAHLPDGTSAGGNKRGQYVVDLQRSRTSQFQVASGDYSVVVGGARNTASASFSAALSGQNNTVAAQHSIVCGGNGNNIINSGASFSTIAGGEVNNVDGARSYAFIGGGYNNRVGGNYGTVCGGQSNIIGTNGALGAIVGGQGNTGAASATHISIIGGASNYVSGSYGAVVGGSSNTVSGQRAVVLGGTNNVASGFGATAGGSTCTASGNYAVALGEFNTANAPNGIAIGRYANTQSLNGCEAFASGCISANGDIQKRRVILNNHTTDATPKNLVVGGVEGGTIGTATTLCPQIYTMQRIQGEVIARIPASTADFAIWTFTAYLYRDLSTASVALVAAVTPTLVHSRGTGNTWALAVTANTTVGGLQVTGTGEAGKTIVWGCSLDCFEIQDFS